MMTALLVSGVLLARADSPATITGGDEAFARIDYPAATQIYEQLLRERPDDPDLLWRLARVSVCAAEVLPDTMQLSLLRPAERYARQCIALAPGRDEGHTWLAAALGYLALNAPAAEQVRLSNELLREANQALAINPNSDAALSIKGSVFRAFGNISWLRKRLASLFIGSVPDGGFDEAEVALKHAVELAPDVMRHVYELGVLYLDMGRNEDAVRCLERVVTLPLRVAIDRPRLAKAKELLDQLKNPPN